MGEPVSAPDLDLAIVLIDIAFMAMLAATAIAIVRLRNLFAIVMLSGVYSLVSAAWFVVLDAVDVAFTEAAVGAGVTTILMLGAMLLTKREVRHRHSIQQAAPLAVVIATGSILFYATIDLPMFGDPDAPANAYVGRIYLERSIEDTGVPNVVTSVLASYRGFDTLGETGVIFAAGVAVALLLGFGERSLAATVRQRRRRKR